MCNSDPSATDSKVIIHPTTRFATDTVLSPEIAGIVSPARYPGVPIVPWLTAPTRIPRYLIHSLKTAGTSNVHILIFRVQSPTNKHPSSARTPEYPIPVLHQRTGAHVHRPPVARCVVSTVVILLVSRHYRFDFSSGSVSGPNTVRLMLLRDRGYVIDKDLGAERNPANLKTLKGEQAKPYHTR